MPTPSGAAAGAATGPRGAPLEDDFSTWDHWWEFNKNSYLRLRDARRTAAVQTGSDDFYLGSTRRDAARDSLRPTQYEVVQTILPALKKAIDSTANRDIQSSCMVAMAKAGANHPDFGLFDVFVPRLREGNQEVRETAALAFGIAGLSDGRTLELLAGLVQDSGVGRAARGGEVEDRTRAFAAYSLGLLAHGCERTATKQKAFVALRTIVEDKRLASRNVKVAAIHGIGLLDPDLRTYAEATLAEQAIDVLVAYYEQDLGVGDQFVQAHCPAAIARLVGRDHARSGACKRLFARDLEGDSRRRRNPAIAQSCAQALGQIVRPADDAAADELDVRCNQLLLETWRDHSDVTTRNFAILALAQIGGAGNRTVLLREFDRAGKTQQKPWCALALGVCAFLEEGRGQPRDAGSTPDRLVGETLADALQKAKEPGLVGALAIGLGLCKATEAADQMREHLLANVQKEQMAGYLGVGLALMDDVRSIECLRAVARQSLRRPDLLVQAAVALGKLGDQRIAEDLVEILVEGEPNLAKLAAIASALGQIGDRRTVPTLVQLMFDDDLTMLSRAFAAVALGGVADRRSLPWSTPISENINYRAATETLTDRAAGILDIL